MPREVPLIGRRVWEKQPIKLTVKYVYDPNALEGWFRLIDALLRVDLRRHLTSETALTASDLRDDDRKAEELVQVPSGGAEGARGANLLISLGTQAKIEIVPSEVKYSGKNWGLEPK